MDETNSLIEQRKAKLAALRAKGINPFANKFTPTETCDHARSNYVENREVALAGRITAHREMGKSMFIDIKDQSGRIQVYAQKQALGDDQFDIFKHLDLGDFIGVNGTLFTTKTGEPSVKLVSFVILTKALRPPPEKWHGLVDTEIRYRQRYLDLMANDEVKKTFLLRRRTVIREIRNFFHSRGYVEVETPMMQNIPGGAAAAPFVTHHNALNCNFFLRIAIELYHKRLLVGGIDKLFEIGKNFRNERLSRKHNPEFTMLEAYQAYGDYETMMDLVQSLVVHVAEHVLDTLYITHPRQAETDSVIQHAAELLSKQNTPEDFERHFQGELENLRVCFSEFDAPYGENERPSERAKTAYSHLANLNLQIFHDFIMKYVVVGSKETDPKTIFLDRLELLRDKLAELSKEKVINLTPPWRRAKYKDLVREKAGADWFDVAPAERRRRAIEDLKLGGDIAAGYEDFEVTGAVFEKLIEPTLIDPTFVTHLPKELVPLAKLSPEDPDCVEVFECCINGQEIAPAYTEQNDPIAQRDTLEHQAGGEQQKLDEDFLVALEHGMPPAGGMGMGIDRLCMMLLGQESIRDVILFPQMKPKS